MKWECTGKQVMVAIFTLFVYRTGFPQQIMNETDTAITFDERGELKITPSSASSPEDFDFLAGDHHVHHRKLKSRLSDNHEWVEFEGSHTMAKLLRGKGNMESHFIDLEDGPFEGMALRLFDPSTRLWSIYWSDTKTLKLDVPVVGSFENHKGRFFTKDVFKGKEIIIQFLWDVTDPQRPVWSQAFSDDHGKTWEWNWFMYFSKKNPSNITHHANSVVRDSIRIIELRNYLLKPGSRNRFAGFFHTNLVKPQQNMGGFIMGEFSIKNDRDNFLWIRGFESMPMRSKFLPDFYNSQSWKQHRETANGMIVNNDNVYLLKPVALHNGSAVDGTCIPYNWFQHQNGIGVIDFYVANGKRDQLLAFYFRHCFNIAKMYASDLTLWISETAENDFPRLPVFQDKNLMVTIAFYRDEDDYQSSLRKINEALPQQVKNQQSEIVTLRSTQVIYPINN